MSIKARADKAHVHWLTEDTHGEVLGRDTGILYVPKWAKTKLGQVTRFSAEGLTPQQTFVARYQGASSSSQDDIEAEDLFVIPKPNGENFSYDDGIRALIHHLYTQGKVPFDALYPQHQLPNMNSEGLVGYDREAHLPILLNVIKQYFGFGQFYDTKTPITWRWGQEEEIQDICTRLMKHQLCLYAAFTGRGKTKIAVEVAARVIPAGGIVLVTTPITDTKQGFSDDINTTHFGPTRQRQTTFMDGAHFRQHTIEALRARADAGELIFVVLTVQDLRWGEAVDNLDTAVLRDRYQKLSGNLKLWIRDERHAQYNGLVTSTRLSQLSAEMELDLTATPYNCFDLYDRKHLVTRTLLWGLLNRPHTRLPEIGIDALSLAACEISPRIQALYSVEEGYDPRKLFARDGENFLLESELVALSSLFYESTLSRNKNPLSISNDTELSPAAKQVGMWVLPSGKDGDGASDYIPSLAALLNTRSGSKILWCDSYTLEHECPTGVSIGAYVENLRANSGKSLVILTCGKFLTGTNIPSMGHVVLFDKMNSIANFEQLMGRTIREYANKSKVKLYCLAPGAQLRVVMGRMALKSSELSGGEPAQLLDCVPLTEYTGGSWNRLTSVEVLSTVQEWFREQVRKLIPGTSVLRSIADADLSVWRGVDMSSLKMMLPKSRLNEDIGGRVKDKKSKGSEAQKEREQGVPEEKIRELIQNVVYEAQWVGYSMNTSDWQQIITSPAISGMFGEAVVQAFASTMSSCSRLETLVREHLQTKHQAYVNLPYSEVYDELFGNSKLKQSIGLVYVPVELARELVANLLKKKYNKIMVVNALNGALPLALREAFPDAEIVCGEAFPYFRTHLESLGFATVEWNRDWGDMKFDLVIGNPPYQTSSGNETGGKSALWRKFVRHGWELVRDKGIICMVVPQLPNSSQDLGDIFVDYQTTKVWTKIQHHFPGIGSSFTAWCVEKTPKTGPALFVIENTYVDITKEKLPRDIQAIGLVKKFTDFPNKIAVHSSKQYKHTSVADGKDEHLLSSKCSSKLLYKIRRTNGDTKYMYGAVEPDEYFVPKVTFTYSGNPGFIFHDATDPIGTIGFMSGHVVVKNESEAQSLISLFESKPYVYVRYQISTGGMKGQPIYTQPLLPLDRIWTNELIYKELDLSDSEIQLIESSVTSSMK